MTRAVLVAAVLVAAAGPAAPAAAAATLTIEPISWNVIGLDSNDVTAGPNRFVVGARVCNTGDAAATGVVASFAWESANALIGLNGPDQVPLGEVASGTCEDAYFLAEVTRDPAAWFTSRRFRIEATGDGLGAVSTPTPRELLVEKLISQNRNDAISLAGPTEVFVGQTVTYDVVASTATNGYEQLENFLPFPPGVLRIRSVQQTYSAPTGATNDRVYADACGWDDDPTSPTYLTCAGPEQFAGGKAGGDITTSYTVEVVGTGTAVLSDLIYDFSGSSYHYNADFGDPALTVTAVDPIDLELTKSVDEDAPLVGDEVTFALSLTNAGSTAATGVTVTDHLPATLELVSASATPGSYDAESGVWTVGALDGGDVATLLIVATTTTGEPLTNVAEVTAADQPDADSVPANGDPTEDDQSSVDVAPRVPPDPEPSPSPGPSPSPTASPGPAGSPSPAAVPSPDAPTAQPEAEPGELPRTGTHAADRRDQAAMLLVAGWLALVAAHRLDKRQRLRAIDEARARFQQALENGDPLS